MLREWKKKLLRDSFLSLNWSVYVKVCCLWNSDRRVFWCLMLFGWYITLLLRGPWIRVYPLIFYLLDYQLQVDRKLVKQTVMTSVYGVTYVGAREQIKRRLKARDMICDDSELFSASCYAAKVECLIQWNCFISLSYISVIKLTI